MSAFDWAAAIGGGLLLWTALALAVGFPLGRAMRRADEAVQLDAALIPLPERSPLDLTGYALDAEFFATLAPSFPEYR